MARIYAGSNAERAADIRMATARLHDALTGVLDWIEEGCPEGGHVAVEEAKMAVAYHKSNSEAK